MPATSILIKLASSACNINCSYFFYKKLSAKKAFSFNNTYLVLMIVIQSQNGLEWKLGTINDFNDLIKSDKAKNFVSCSLPVNDKCKKCKYLYLCRGGCRRWKEPFINGEPSLNCLCGAYEKFFEHCIDRIYLLANIIKIKNVILNWLIMSQLFLFINIVYRKIYNIIPIEFIGNNEYDLTNTKTCVKISKSGNYERKMKNERKELI